MNPPGMTVDEIVQRWKKEERRWEHDNEKLLYWLLRAYIATRRQGWEQGPTHDEVFADINRVLADFGVCGHRECDEIEERRKADYLLRRYDRKEWRDDDDKTGTAG
jgi:hypothetical protein